MSGVLGVAVIVWAFVTVALLLAAGLLFGAPLSDDVREKEFASRLARTAPVWPIWVAVQIVRALRWQR